MFLHLHANRSSDLLSYFPTRFAEFEGNDIGCDEYEASVEIAGLSNWQR